MTQPTAPALPETPPNCVRCGAPPASAEYCLIAQLGRRRLAVAPPVSLLVPKRGQPFRWVGLCRKHQRRRRLAACGILLVVNVAALALLALAMPAMDRGRPGVAVASVCGAGFLMALGSLLALWRLSVLRVPGEASNAADVPLEPQLGG